MPMPKPTGPGEEPTDEATVYRYHLRRLITWYLEALDPLAPAAFVWRPPAPDGNSLAAICVHAIASAEWWVLSCVGDGPIERAAQHVRLRPGDIIGSGTCGTGCILELGTERHRWLQPGDVVELEIERLGLLRNPIAAAKEG